MTIGTIIGGVEALVGLVTANPALIIDGTRRTATSVIVSTALEPVKEVVGEGVSTIIDSVN